MKLTTDNISTRGN